MLGLHLEAIIKQILLIHWDAPEARARVARLESFGYQASHLNRPGPPLMRAILADPPSAVVIDLSRLPLQGRDVAVDLRAHPATRQIPIVFVDGLPEKVLPVRQTLPDAVYSTWTHLAEDLTRTFNRPARAVVVPQTDKPASARASLAAKVGIEPNTVAALLGAPPEFMTALEPLPKGAVLRRQLGDDCTLVIWFARSRRELEQGMALRAARLGAARLWVLWPKHGAGQSGDVSPDFVRGVAEAQGLAHEKATSIDTRWSGMLFSRAAG
jgi:CheY-like chemotaxis protein